MLHVGWGVAARGSREAGADRDGPRRAPAALAGARPPARPLRGGRLRRSGAGVAVAARTRSQVDEAVSLLRQTGRCAVGIACDLRQPDAAFALADAVERDLGPIDVLVNAVGGSAATMPALLPEDGGRPDVALWRDVFELNLLTVVHACAAVAPRWRPAAGAPSSTSAAARARRQTPATRRPTSGRSPPTPPPRPPSSASASCSPGSSPAAACASTRSVPASFPP